MKQSFPVRGLVAGLCLLGACSDPPPTPSSPSPARPPGRSAPATGPTDDALPHADLPHAAEHPQRWLKALASPDPGQRALAALAYPLLDEPPPEPMARAVAAESDPTQLGRLLQVAGRARPPLPADLFDVALTQGPPALQAGACLGLTVASLRSSDLPHTQLARLLDRHPEGRPAPNEAVRTACALALARLPPPTLEEEAQGLALDLDAALTDDCAEVRLAAAEALERYPAGALPHLADALVDPDWRVAAAAYRAYAHQASEDAYAAALTDFADRVLADASRVAGTGLRVWEAAMRAAARLPSSATRLERAEALLTTFADTLLAAQPAPGLAAAHCELAAWVDAQRRWPGRLRGCGDGLAPAALVYFHEARLVAAQPSDPALRATYLLRMLQRGPEARTAVLSSASRVHDVGLLPALVELLASGSDADAGRAARVAVELSALLSHDDPRRIELGEALQHRLQALPAGASPLALAALLDALAALDHPTSEPRALQLLNHPSPLVAAASRRRLAPLMEPDPIPEEATAPPSPPPSDPPPTELTLRLPSGNVRIALEPDAAPASVAALVAAVGAGWLADAPLSPRSHPPEVLVGDPYASTPGEVIPVLLRTPNGAPSQRGSVVLVAAGPHSDTLALRVLLSRRPQLDGASTRVGRVVSGLDALASSIHGQTVQAVSVRRAGESQAPSPARIDVSP